jgi:hypothetical protein
MLPFEFGLRHVRLIGIAALIATALVPGPLARAQSDGSATAAAPSADVPVVISGSATSASRQGAGYHILRARTAAGKHAPLNGPVVPPKTAGAAVRGVAGLARPGFFPADLTNFSGGTNQTLTSGNSLNVYYNCADSTCFGNPEQFQKDLAVSNFIHVVDAYVGSRAKNRYPLSTVAPIHINNASTFLSASDIVNMVNTAVASAGTNGTDHIFHIFLPEGVDTCSDAGNTQCYSPDQLDTFTFCGYHATTNIGGNDVFYTVIPFNNVEGCMLAPPNPNSALIDSTNSVLSHELFEVITDPFPGTAWLANNSLAEEGNEIGDICEGAGNDSFQEIVTPFVLIKGKSYQTQLEYSNARHGCVLTP